jgi:hypothetical protein
MRLELRWSEVEALSAGAATRLEPGGVIPLAAAAAGAAAGR